MTSNAQPTTSATPVDPPLGFWLRFRFLGPSLILTATLVGSGELIITTLFGAQVGFTALWIIVLACLLKVAIQEALGRYTISSGLTTLRIMDRLPGPRYLGSWAVWFWLFVVITGATQAMSFATDEIFGPLSAVFKFDSEDEAVSAANATDFGLAAYLYTRDVGRIFRLNDDLDYGLIGVNSGLITTVEAPFGGLKESGMGKEGGSQGLDDYLETKYVCIAGVT